MHAWVWAPSQLCPCAFKGVVHARERRSVYGIAECRGYLEQTIHPESTAGPGVELLSVAERPFRVYNML